MKYLNSLMKKNWYLGTLMFLMIFIFGFVQLYIIQIKEYKTSKDISTSVVENISSDLSDRLNNAKKISELLLPRVVMGYGDNKVELEKRLKSLVPLLGNGFSIQWAPNGIVRSSVPYGKNDHLIGVNIIKESYDRAKILNAISSKKSIWVGPYSKSSGDKYIEYVIPIYSESINNEDREFKGIAKITVNLTELISKNTKYHLNNNYIKIDIYNKNIENKNYENNVFDNSNNNEYSNVFLRNLFKEPFAYKKIQKSELEIIVYSKYSKVYYSDIVNKIIDIILVSFIFTLFIVILNYYRNKNIYNTNKYSEIESLKNALIDTDDVSILVLTELGKIEFANNKFIVSYGYDYNETLNNNIYDLIIEKKKWESFQIHNNNIIKEEIITFNKTGDVIPSLISISPFNEGGINVVKYLCVMRDITQLKAAQQARLQFISNISHDLRTPLNAILGYGSLLERASLNGEERDRLTRLNQAGSMLLSLVNDVLDWSKIEAGEIDLHKEAFSLTEKCEAMMAVMEDQAQRKGLAFTLIKSNDVPTFVIGDSTRFQQIMFNLVGNAIKFTNEGEIVVRSSVINTKKTDKIRLKFEIIDSGVGIPIEDQKFLFERFRQVNNSSIRHQQGTGLGLAIVKQLTDIMDGSVHVISEVGKGTTFIVELEFDRADTVQAIEKLDNESILFSLENINILLVDDSDLIVELAEFMLIDAGAAVATCSNGQEALDWLETHEAPDIILMDVQMPVMDGLLSASLIRKHGAYDRLPIIAMTAGAAKTNIDEALCAGMTDYITKPFTQEQLIDVVVKNLKR